MLSIALIVHKLTVLITVVSFFLRGIGHIFNKSWVHKKFFKIFPHINDTLLIVSAVIVVYLTATSFTEQWIIAKFLALFAYIFLGVMAFKKARTRLMKAIYWLLGLSVLVYLIAVAKTKLIWPFVQVTIQIG